jgi:hypothetical protein
MRGLYNPLSKKTSGQLAKEQDTLMVYSMMYGAQRKAHYPVAPHSSERGRRAFRALHAPLLMLLEVYL